MPDSDKKVIRVYGHGLHGFCKEGHDRQFMQAKYALPNVHLTIGLIDDKTIVENSKEEKVELLYNELERQELILHCRHVDEVLSNVPWTLDQEFLDKHKFDYVTITDQNKGYLFTDKKTSESAKFIDRLQAEGRYLRLERNSIEDSGPQPMVCDLSGKIASFSDDAIATEKRNKCSYDFNNRISLEDAKKISTPERPIRVYADGIYDMFHPGHARQLKQAKEAFSHVHLMVGVVNDELTYRYKGPTVVPEVWRYDRVRHCRYVDEVIRDPPWVICNDFLMQNKIDFVAHDDIPYKCEGQEDVYKHVKELGMFLATQRMEGISTTDLKLRLKSNC